jgi:hypothetical protein
MKIHLKKKFYYFILIFIFFSNTANAYIDPGTGSALIQGLIGALAAIIISLKLYWHKLLKFLGIRKSDNENKKEEESNNENK